MNKTDKKLHLYIHPEGWKFSSIFFVTSTALYFVWQPIAWIGYALTFFVIWFFRDPERNAPQDPNLIISSADGKVCLIDEAYPPEELEMDTQKMKRICVFMNVFNVHVNRSPIPGKAELIVYKKGQFLNASLDKASDKNERSSLVIKPDGGAKIIVVQIAGLIARRILCYKDKGDEVKAGERYGFIKFGSRVDLYLPTNASIKVNLGQTVKNTETIIAEI